MSKYNSAFHESPGCFRVVWLGVLNVQINCFHMTDYFFENTECENVTAKSNNMASNIAREASFQKSDFVFSYFILSYVWVCPHVFLKWLILTVRSLSNKERGRESILRDIWKNRLFFDIIVKRLEQPHYAADACRLQMTQCSVLCMQLMTSLTFTWHSNLEIKQML